MIRQQAWVDHVFNLNIPAGWTPNILTRVQDTALRLRHHCSQLSDAQLSQRLDQKWSIKEHVGHLIDLEVLHHHRLNEFAQQRPLLTMADMSNARTDAASHNEQSIEELIANFEQQRGNFLANFYALPEAILHHVARHPRLDVDMKPVDMLFFMAEHDDHHMAIILRLSGDLRS